MKIFIYFSVLLSCLSNYQVQVQGQLLSLIVDALNPIYEAFSDPNGRFQTPPPSHFQGQFPGIDHGTQFPQATGRDELFPADCGRHTHDGTGKMCFPDGILCQNRLNNGGIEQYRGRNYLFSWQSNDAGVRSANWDWFNARNYCRKRCMDLVSIETQDEYQWLKQRIENVKYIWTSGRLCNFDGCDRPDFFPKSINGWFWSANQARLNPTNGTAFQDWSFTGGFNPPRRQPDNREATQQGGEEEACMAVLNNFYGDGIKWHDVACHHEKPIVCEDTEGHLNFARQQFPQIRIP